MCIFQQTTIKTIFQFIKFNIIIKFIITKNQEAIRSNSFYFRFLNLTFHIKILIIISLYYAQITHRHII